MKVVKPSVQDSRNCWIRPSRFPIQGDVWFFDKPARNDLHPTMKPVALVERAIRNSSKGRDTVLDPFGGSGRLLGADGLGGQDDVLRPLAHPA